MHCDKRPGGPGGPDTHSTQGSSSRRAKVCLCDVAYLRCGMHCPTQGLRDWRTAHTAVAFAYKPIFACECSYRAIMKNFVLTAGYTCWCIRNAAGHDCGSQNLSMFPRYGGVHGWERSPDSMKSAAVLQCLHVLPGGPCGGFSSEHSSDSAL